MNVMSTDLSVVAPAAAPSDCRIALVGSVDLGSRRPGGEAQDELADRSPSSSNVSKLSLHRSLLALPHSTQRSSSSSTSSVGDCFGGGRLPQSALKLFDT